MPHWLQALLGVLGALASWRFALRPLRKTWRELLLLLRQIRDASGGIQKLARDIEALSGSIVQLATQIIERQEDHEGRLKDLGDLYVDLVATVARNRKRIEHLEGPDDDAARS
jgi:CII-binding regulator of phage lambda lysogenization HflD